MTTTPPPPAGHLSEENGGQSGHNTEVICRLLKVQENTASSTEKLSHRRTQSHKEAIRLSEGRVLLIKADVAAAFIYA